MRVIIAGSRTINDYDLLKKVIKDSEIEITAVISGGARGVDLMGEQWAEENNIPVEAFPANWDKYGRSAGPRRNALMAERADALIAIWDGVSAGTLHMLKYARNLGNMRVYVHRTDIHLGE